MMEEDRNERIPVIEVKNLYKVYRIGQNKVYALNGVDMTVYKGEFCSIVGTSGSGKSTMLNMLAGLEKPTKGSIRIAGQNIEKLNENQLVKFRREKVGFIFQSFNLLGTMNAVENVALPLSFRGIARKVRLKRASKMLDLVGLKKQKKHKPNQMSGGQQQRVGVARALVVNPQIIFADEPTGNLDSHTSAEVMELMRKVVKEQNKTLVMVTHDNHLATFADRIFHIIDGKIVKVEVRDHSHEGSVTEAKTVEELTQEEFTITDGQKLSEKTSEEHEEQSEIQLEVQSVPQEMTSEPLEVAEEQTAGRKTDRIEMDGRKTDGMKTNGIETDGMELGGIQRDGRKTDGVMTDERKTDGIESDQLLGEQEKKEENNKERVEEI